MVLHKLMLDIGQDFVHFLQYQSMNLSNFCSKYWYYNNEISVHRVKTNLVRDGLQIGEVTRIENRYQIVTNLREKAMSKF